MGTLDGRRALITGSGRGIGRATALAFAREGATVVVSARTGSQVESVVAEINAAGGRAVGFTADVDDDESVTSLQQRVAQELDGPVDILISNAGIYMARRFADYTMDEWQRMLSVNVLGAVRVIRAFLPSMLERGEGRVLIVASTAGKWGSLYQSAYNVSKHALIGLTRCLALETASRGVRVNALCPGWVETGMIDTAELAGAYQVPEDDVRRTLLQRVPIGRMVTPDEVAALAVYLASPLADAMTGQSITLAGGMLLI
ncbi:MAG: SDR family oxidoreductase [Candidatus Dormibacteraeota bacterium]|nr:SDR family oxidoreductase [Candidatus Dormibacteraeota bacterium]MBV9525077.1 SDR family oxidoreductase [Candidatus Dormibacteraeota bacterium]